MSSTYTEPVTTGERADFLQMLAKHRGFLKFTVKNLTDEQANQRTTVSELTLGGLIKHVAATERGWANFILEGAAGMFKQQVDWEAQFSMRGNETLEGLLAQYEEIAARTDELVRTVDLDESHPLPEAPWFEKGAAWSNRRVLMHIIAETSQHSGHADIIREGLDGSKTMG
ncbi:putative damage-inducible protein DinB [Kibdelosporangium banguiense]|uniref:Damage-inducible protein DinB n=1 Tax=Kibdelosporangium banguiense TaxID=1365924 RepID=A0ABS4TMV3_9PSEU|nr:DinB family protein [Kibdelosporangium banguiense]MBP2325253.1 putative damage-inducible protein DinB [Kibdelosporangium banguiense]